MSCEDHLQIFVSRYIIQEHLFLRHRLVAFLEVVELFKIKGVLLVSKTGMPQRPKRK